MSESTNRREGMPAVIRDDASLSDLAALWEEVATTADQQGIDPRRQPIVVSDEHQIAALRALEVVGAVQITGSEQGVEVRLTYEEPAPPTSAPSPTVTAAAKRHTFAKADEGDNAEEA